MFLCFRQKLQTIFLELTEIRKLGKDEKFALISAFVIHEFVSIVIYICAK
jgi:hypothetical protein